MYRLIIAVKPNSWTMPESKMIPAQSLEIDE